MKRFTVPACLAIASATTFPALAYALPNGFPDLSQFTETTVEHIKRSTQASSFDSFASFRTPDGLVCQAYSGSSAGCWGSSLDAIPGFPAEAPNSSGETMPCLVPSVTFGGVRMLTDPPSPGAFQIASHCDESRAPVLPAGEKVTLGSTVCIVGENRLTACTGDNHGFVIQPSGSWVF